MRSLSSSLLAAQKASSGVPYVEVEASNRIANIPNLRWERTYTAGNPDDEHDAAADSDYLHRVRVRAGTVEYERDAGSGWTSLSSSDDATHVAIAAVNDERVFVVYNRGLGIFYRESTDQGGSWGSETLIATSTPAPEALAVAYKNASGDLVVIWENNAKLRRIRRTGGSFGSTADWTNSVNSINGVDVVHAGDFHVVLTGADTDGRPVVLTCILGDGFSITLDTWTALEDLAGAEDGSGVTFRAPSLAVLDAHRLFFVEKYSGDIAYTRAQSTWFPAAQSFAANAWREPVPFDCDKEEGVAVTGAAGTARLSNPSGVWEASLSSPTTDLSADAEELALELRPSRGRARVTLRNDDGRYNDLPTGDYSVIRPGAQLAVSPGYVTAQGQKVSSGLEFWIDGWEHTSAGGEAKLVLYASDAWALLERWRARQQHTWEANSRNISQILTFVFGRAGIELLNVGGSSTASSHRPDFTIHPGEDGLRAVQRLLAMTPDVVLVSGEFALLFEPKDDDADVYAYGTDHAIFRARYASGGLAANRAQVFGDDVVAEKFDWGDIEDQLDRLRQVHDLNLNTSAKAEDRADATLRQQELSLNKGELVAPVNCGQELYDVVAVTDPNTGLDDEDFRVTGIDLKYSRRGRKPTYEQRILLGKV